MFRSVSERFGAFWKRLGAFRKRLGGSEIEYIYERGPDDVAEGSCQQGRHPEAPDDFGVFRASSGPLFASLSNVS